MPRRSYDQYCPLSRALDVIGERWTLLIVRELLAGPRRYTDLHADLPGVSTDVLATRLKEMEQDGLISRRRLPPPAAASVYELSPRGRDLLPALTLLAGRDGPRGAAPHRRAARALVCHPAAAAGC